MDTTWIKHPIILEDEYVRLEPLQSHHFPELEKIGSQHPEIWNYLPCNGADLKELKAALQEALLKRLSGEHYPFVIIEKATNEIVGSTRFIDIQPQHRKLEIGWTWMSPKVWGTKLNSSCKYLLLNFCFEELQTIRVQIKTREKNIRSRKAIEKLGAKLEGILRNDRITHHGAISNTYVYSILPEEWEVLKLNK